MARKIDPSKRSSIVEAGSKILLRDGYAAAKMSDIAAEAKVAPGTLYLYFESKDALASAIGEDFFARLGEEMTQLIGKLDQRDGVSNLVDFSVRIGTKERALLALLKQRMPEDICAETSPRMVFRRNLAGILTELMTRENVRQYEPYSLADVVMSILHGVMISCIFTQAADITALKASAVKVLQHALFDDALACQKNAEKVAGSKTDSAVSAASV